MRQVFGPDYTPGDHGFDPFGFVPAYCNTPEKMMEMKTKEIRNGRLAMIAIVGMLIQQAVTGHVWPLN